MSFLVLDDGGAGIIVPIAPAGAVRKAPEIIGSDSRAFDGSLRSSVRAVKTNFQFTSKGLTDTNAAAVEALVESGAFIVVTGDALGAKSGTSYRVTTGDGGFVKVAGGFRRVVMLSLRES